MCMKKEIEDQLAKQSRIDTSEKLALIQLFWQIKHPLIIPVLKFKEFELL